MTQADTPERFSLGTEKHELDERPQVDEEQPELTEEPSPPGKRRSRLLTWLISLLAVALVAIAYLDVRRNLSNLSDAGSQSLQSLATDLQSRIAALSVQVAKLEESAQQRSTELKGATDQLRNDLQAATKNLQQLAGSKASAEDLRKAVAESEKNLKPLQDQIGGLPAKLSTLEEGQRKLQGDVSQQAQALQKELAALRHSVTELNTSKLGRQDLKEQLADQRDNYQQMVNLLTRKLESRFTALEERVGQIERAQRRQGPTSAPAYPAPSDRPTSPPSSRPSIYD